MARRGIAVVIAAVFGLVVLVAIALDAPGETAAVASAQKQTELLLNPVAKRKLKEAVALAGKAPSTGERNHIQNILLPIANHLAVRFLYSEVAERARANPTVPGHQAMEKVLASKRELNSIEAEVKNKLFNQRSGHWAEEIHHKVPRKFHKLLPALTTQTAHTATVHAFKHLREQMLRAEKNPEYMKHLKPSDPNMRR
mmetsp:Transcript_49259/g.118144  ORF Transcript_49259/g.118144 Transcript_49259/m.118144 type:complete len:198 (+) Transcript_49259:1-594(+)